MRSLIFISALSIIFSTSALSKTIPAPAKQELQDEDEFETFGAEIEIFDPYEKYNRKIYRFNDISDRYLLEPVAKSYDKFVPSFVRKTIRNFLTNLSLPISTTNSLLQGKTDNGLATFSHFLINSTIGIGGLFDVAGKKEICYKAEDFGQTLGSYGKGSGSYLMIPFLGPSSTRDFSGWLVDKAVNPLGFNLLDVGGEKGLVSSDYRLGLMVVSGIDLRESLIDIIDDIRTESFDPYATIRSAYLQKRATDVKN